MSPLRTVPRWSTAFSSRVSISAPAARISSALSAISLRWYPNWMVRNMPKMVVGVASTTLREKTSCKSNPLHSNADDRRDSNGKNMTTNSGLFVESQ